MSQVFLVLDEKNLITISRTLKCQLLAQGHILQPLIRGRAVAPAQAEDYDGWVVHL